MPYIQNILLLVACYAIGCLCAGYYLVRFRHRKDIRSLGSGSVGARNVGRLLGRSGFILTLILDTVKGALAVRLACRFGSNPELEIGGILAVAIGHIWPVQLRFRGGKGMAVTLGGLLVLDVRLAIGGILLLAFLYMISKNDLISGLLAVAGLPIISIYLEHQASWVIGLTALTALLYVAHHSNIRCWLQYKRQTMGTTCVEDEPGR
ncbi:MAG: glycerol-3-phosphate acyltransferase [Sedimentisphaerales bacterium]|nr:glycerol-3-phosphate acyltransferase [Sedimentisphaerales bacterium]